MDDLTVKLKDFAKNYFDLYSKVDRKYFITFMLIYSLVVMIVMIIFTDYETAAINKQFMENEVIRPLNEGSISMQQASFMISQGFMRPSYLLVLFAATMKVLLIPLYIRRLNDTDFSAYAVIPVIILYGINFLNSLINASVSVGPYLTKLMVLYTFVLIILMTFAKSSKNISGE